MVCSVNEFFIFYGLLVEYVWLLEDCFWIEFKLWEGIYFFDGFFLMVDDVIFFFNMFKEKGWFNLWCYYVVVEIVE